MIYSMSGTEALQKREMINSPGTGIAHWGTVFFGPRSSTSVAPGPQATGLVARFGFRGGDTPGALHHALRRESCRARVVAEASLWLRLDQR